MNEGTTKGRITEALVDLLPRPDMSIYRDEGTSTHGWDKKKPEQEPYGQCDKPQSKDQQKNLRMVLKSEGQPLQPTWHIPISTGTG